jgi:hypothetical protein
MERTSSGQARRLRRRGNNLPEFRESGSDVPVGTAASARSTQALRCLIEASAFHTLIRQRPPTPSCRGLSPYCGENSEPGRCIKGELDFQPRVREQPGLQADSGGVGRSPAKPTRTTRPDYPSLTSGCPRSRLRASHSGGVALGLTHPRPGKRQPAPVTRHGASGWRARPAPAS